MLSFRISWARWCLLSLCHSESSQWLLCWEAEEHENAHVRAHVRGEAEEMQDAGTEKSWETRVRASGSIAVSSSPATHHPKTRQCNLHHTMSLTPRVMTDPRNSYTFLPRRSRRNRRRILLIRPLPSPAARL